MAIINAFDDTCPKWMDWQHIKTAPKDGTELLLYIPDVGAIQGWWFESSKEIDDGWETILGFLAEPTYWMTLPNPPETKGEKE